MGSEYVTQTQVTTSQRYSLYYSNWPMMT